MKPLNNNDFSIMPSLSRVCHTESYKFLCNEDERFPAANRSLVVVTSLGVVHLFPETFFCYSVRPYVRQENWIVVTITEDCLLVWTSLSALNGNLSRLNYSRCEIVSKFTSSFNQYTIGLSQRYKSAPLTQEQFSVW